MEQVWLAIIVAMSAVLTGSVPIVLRYLDNKNKIDEKAQDYARQDVVANRASEASREMLARQDAATAAQEDATRVATIARQQSLALQQATHTLVNSSYEAVLKAELEATKRELAALREIMALKSASGHQPGVEALSVIETAERRISELVVILANRKRKDELVQAQLEEGQAPGKIADAAAAAAKPAAEQAARKVVPPVVTEVVPPVVKAAVKEALNEHDKTK